MSILAPPKSHPSFPKKSCLGWRGRDLFEPWGCNIAQALPRCPGESQTCLEMPKLLGNGSVSMISTLPGKGWILWPIPRSCGMLPGVGAQPPRAVCNPGEKRPELQASRAAMAR